MNNRTVCNPTPVRCFPLALLLFLSAAAMPLLGCGPDNSTEQLQPVPMTPEQLEQERATPAAGGA